MNNEDERRMLEQFERELPATARHDEPSGTLFHYTNSVALEAILRTGLLRATHYRHLNDATELEEGERITLRAAQELCDEPGISDFQTRFRGRFLEVLKELTPTKMMRDIFVVSFSEKGNDLGQWRAYGDHGAGFSLGIKFVVTNERGVNPTALGGMLVRCEYDREAALRRAKMDLVRVFQGTEVYFDTYRGKLNPQLLVDRGMNIAALRAAWQSLRVKHPAFRDEAEWRFIVIPNANAPEGTVKFRTSRLGLVPYVEVPIYPSGQKSVDVEEIYVGPTLHPGDSVHAIELLLASLGNQRQNIVKASGIPFRG